MQPRHHVVNTKEDVGFGVINASVGVGLSREDSIMELMLVFKRLNDHKDACKGNRNGEIDNQPFILVHLSRTNRHRHCERTSNQYDRIDCTPKGVEFLAGKDIQLRIPGTVHDVGEEQPAKKQDFCD